MWGRSAGEGCGVMGCVREECRGGVSHEGMCGGGVQQRGGVGEGCGMRGCVGEECRGGEVWGRGVA